MKANIDANFPDPNVIACILDEQHGLIYRYTRFIDEYTCILDKHTR